MSSLAETVKEFIQQERKSGMRQEEIAKKHGLLQGQIQKILSEPQRIEGIKLKTFARMFPNAVIDLNGDGKHVSTFAAVDDRRVLELEKKNLELEKKNLELNKENFELTKRISAEDLSRRGFIVPGVKFSSSENMLEAFRNALLFHITSCAELDSASKNLVHKIVSEFKMPPYTLAGEEDEL